jgi:hypothetical protein
MVLAIGLAALSVVAIPGGSAVFAAPATDCTSSEPSLVGGVYQIDTPGKLLHVAEGVTVANSTFADASLLQTADLDLTACGNWPGIGRVAEWFTYVNPDVPTDTYPDYIYGKPFTGVYDGGGKTISGLTTILDFTTSPPVVGEGLFGQTDGAEIRNVKIVNGNVVGGSNLGGLIGKALNTQVSNSSFSGVVKAENEYRVGGLIGYSEGSTVIGSSTAGTVETNSSYQGGLIGEAESTTVTSSFSTTNATGYRETGGLIGRASNSTVSGSFATGSVTGFEGIGYVSDAFGGLIGAAVAAPDKTTTVTNSYATGAVTADGNAGSGVGGLIGLASKLTLTNTFATGLVTVTGPYVGGLIGGTQFFYGESTVTGSVWDVTSTSQIGTSMGEPKGGSGKTTAQMKAFPTFRAAGWAITTDDDPRIWGLCDDGSSYPFLMWQTLLAAGSPGAVTCTVGDGALGLKGAGTEADPYQISTYEDLLLLAGETSIWGKNFVQTADIAFPPGTDMTPIGVSKALPFTGSYDGGGYSITGLVIDTPSLDYVGLFGFTNGAEISDLTVSATVTGDSYVGGLIGRADNTTISNVFVSGKVTGSGSSGGLIGDARSGTTVTGAYVSADVTGGWGTGGLIGYSDEMSVVGSSATGDVTSTDGSIGGLIGYAYDTSISNSYAAGDVDGDIEIGGLIGYLDGSSISNSYATGLVAGSSPVGGLVGETYPTISISGSFWDTTTSGQGSSTGGGTGKTTPDMTTRATFSGVSWSIVAGWEASAPPTKVWGMCAAVNSGYPFLLGEFAEDPCGGDGDGGGGGDGSGDPAPVPVNGVLPEMDPGDVMVFDEDGNPVTVNVFVENTSDLVVDGTTFGLRLSGECETGCTVDEIGPGQFVLNLVQGGAARAEGSGFEPGSLVDLWLFSEPRYLGQLTVGIDGTFGGTVDLGDVAVGAHTLQVNGSSQGELRSANLGVLVAAAASSSGGSMSWGFEMVSELPDTGVSDDHEVLMVLALVLTVCGTLMLMARRPRRS